LRERNRSSTIPDPKSETVVFDEIEVELDLGFDDEDDTPVPTAPVDAAPAPKEGEPKEGEPKEGEPKEGEPKESEPETPDRAAELMALTSKGLTALCKKKGLSGTGKKAVKVARILAAESTTPPEDPEDFGVDLGPDLETIDATASGQVQAAVAAALSGLESEPAEPEPATPPVPTLTLEDMGPVDSAENLDFSSVGIHTWKVKVKIGLTYDFSDFRTLQKYIHDGRVTNEDTISYDKGESWKTLGDIPDLEAYFIQVFQVAKLARARELALEPAASSSEAPTLSSPLGAELAQEALRQVTEEVELPAPTPHGPSFDDPFERLKSQQSQRNSTRRQHQAVKAEDAQRRRVASQRQMIVLSLLALAASMVFWMSKDLSGSTDPTTDATAVALPSAPTEQPGKSIRELVNERLKEVDEEEPLDAFLQDMEPTQRIAVRPPEMGGEDAAEDVSSEDPEQPVRKLTTIRSPGEYARAGEEAMGNGNYGLALVEFKHALAANPGQASWRAAYGKCLYRMGQYADARDELVQAQRAGVNDTEVLQMLVDSFNRLGDPSGASTYRQMLDR
jgi:tetratricopeptide (TPR) repeat protein